MSSIMIVILMLSPIKIKRFWFKSIKLMVAIGI